MTFTLDPDARLDFGVDWSDFLESAGDDTITTHAWVDVTTGLTVEDEQLLGGAVHLAFFSGGNSGEVHSATSSIETNGGRKARATIVFTITKE